jgi:four helix bundle protein
MAEVRSFRDLVAYQRARQLRNAAYGVAKSLPRECQYEIASQIRRAAYSVTLNIAEGYGVGTTQATLRHFKIARGSLAELDAALETLIDWQLVPADACPLDLLSETYRVLHSLILSMEKTRLQQSC